MHSLQKVSGLFLFQLLQKGQPAAAERTVLKSFGETSTVTFTGSNQKESGISISGVEYFFPRGGGFTQTSSVIFISNM